MVEEARHIALQDIVLVVKESSQEGATAQRQGTQRQSTSPSLKKCKTRRKPTSAQSARFGCPSNCKQVIKKRGGQPPALVAQDGPCHATRCRKPRSPRMRLRTVGCMSYHVSQPTSWLASTVRCVSLRSGGMGGRLGFLHQTDTHVRTQAEAGDDPHIVSCHPALLLYPQITTEVNAFRRVRKQTSTHMHSSSMPDLTCLLAQHM